MRCSAHRHSEGALPGVLHDVLRTRVGNSLSAGL